MNLKKIVAAGIAAVCAVSMAACGGSGSGSSKVTDIQYKDIKLGQTGKDIKANLKLFSHRTDMLKNDLSGNDLEAVHRRIQQDLSEHQGHRRSQQRLCQQRHDPSAGR